MSPWITGQALAFLISGGEGAGLGLIYDVGRAIRRERPGHTLTLDLLFFLILLGVLLLTALYSGGLRLYQCVGLCLGAAGYFRLISPGILKALRFCLRWMAGALRPVKKALGVHKKYTKYLKKLFSSSRKWNIIKMLPHSPTNSRPQSGGNRRE